jgi:hypothetical protein
LSRSLNSEVAPLFIVVGFTSKYKFPEQLDLERLVVDFGNAQFLNVLLELLGLESC